VREITPALGLQATKAAGSDSKLGIQVGEQVGHMRPPRVYMSSTYFPNAGGSMVVTKIMEAGGIADAWEIPESADPGMQEKSVDKAAECVQEFLNGFNPDGAGTLFLIGNEELADDVVNRLDIPDDIDVKINEDDLEYIPDPIN